MLLCLVNAFVILVPYSLCNEPKDTSRNPSIRPGTSPWMTSAKTDLLNQKRSRESPEDLLNALNSLIMEEKRLMRKRSRTRTTTSRHPVPKKKIRVRVPRDYHYPEGSSTEAELNTSTDSDTS
nr:MAG: ORF3 [Giant panda anellovirus]